jgi:hypothetical protein
MIASQVAIFARMKKTLRRRIEVDVGEAAPAKTRLYVDEDVAEALRKVARAERMELGPFLEMLLRSWIDAERPQYRVTEAADRSGGTRRSS